MMMTRLVLALTVIGSLLFLASCTPLSIPTATPTQGPAPTAGISIEGHVRINDANGPGLAGAQIYAKGGYGNLDSPSWLLATTDEDGYYWNGNAIPLMAVWVVMDGYAFEPEMQQYMGSDSSCEKDCDFIAIPAK
jgi:hypothetical protein